MAGSGGRAAGTRLALFASALLLATVGACAQEGPEPTVVPVPQASVPTGNHGLAAMDCEDSAILQAPAEALAVFPDSPDVEWTARPAAEAIVDLVLVSMTPEPATVGYPELRFVYRCDAGGPSYLAAYGLEEGTFVLVTTSAAVSGTEIPEQLVQEPPEPS